jgi:hypothetical protein
MAEIIAKLNATIFFSRHCKAPLNKQAFKTKKNGAKEK